MATRPAEHPVTAGRVALKSRIALHEFPPFAVLDAATAFVVATGFTLLNGAVLGFMHPALTDDIKPSAADWRIGTLLFAAACTLFAANGVSGVLWLLPIANACLFIGFALYWRSIRRYVRRDDHPWIFVPAALGIVALTWFTLVSPNLPLRVAIATVLNVFYTVAMASVLLRHLKQERSRAGAFLIVLLAVLTLLVVLRAVYYATLGADARSITAAGSLVAALSPLLIAALPIVGTTAFALLCFERIRSDLHAVATTDALTGLPNRRTIAEEAQRFVAHAKTTGAPFSIAVIDIDHFKQINDRYGHDAGDLVLIGVANALKANVRGAQFVGRQGGEEFVALFESANVEDARVAAERLRAAVSEATYSLGEAHASSESPISATVSIGVATLTANDQSFADLLRRADRALYAAKASGRNCVSTAT
jgi:diguanylate cyclase (GGDEF)-like protein